MWSAGVESGVPCDGYLDQVGFGGAGVLPSGTRFVLCELAQTKEAL